MPEYVRVKQKGTGHELSVVASAVDANPDAYTRLDKAATKADGTPLPPKYHQSLSDLSSTKSSTSEATTTSGRKAKNQRSA